MAKSAAEIVKAVEEIIKQDCPAMVFPLRPWTLKRLEVLVNEYGNDRYDGGRDIGLLEGHEVGFKEGSTVGYEEAIAVRLADEL
jgi:hypothetical protein